MIATLLTAALGFACVGQLLDAPTDAPAAQAVERFQDSPPVRFQVGAVVTAKRGGCRDIFAMVALPLECDLQGVRQVEQDLSPEIGEVVYRDLPGGGARQMLISIPQLAAGAQARAVVTFEVVTKLVLPPSEEEAASLKAPKRLPANLRQFVGPSPYIEARTPRIKKLARQVAEDYAKSAGADANDWGRVEALYDHVLDEIDYVEGPDTSAITTLNARSADCHGRSALFVALCRATGVPARLLWVQDHCYPEFYLEDAEGNGKWYPAESAGTRAFGEMPLARVILQRGDDFRVPERP
ncbi:MAG: transglutaminase-like domain-containing protein, partial [Lacipirellulaceae bacterium]